ncbi:MAG: hypothetical protein KGS72_22985 [Cyanobacteria bacterium REEB67]|nr:hypothetical protein [Cyanobacteria bacterium REEB67]
MIKKCGIFLSLLLATTLGACTESDPDLEAVSTEGTVDLARVKLGTADQVFQEAVVTFVRDQSAQANAGGKRQYLSRGDGNTNGNGGQYIVQVKNGSCFEVSVLYNNHPISRDAAENDMKRLLPADAPAQSRVDDSSLAQPARPNTAHPYEAIYYFGDDYLGEIYFSDKTGSHVTGLKVSNVSLLKQAQADSQLQKDSLKPLVDAAIDQESKEKTAATPGAKVVKRP